MKHVKKLLVCLLTVLMLASSTGVFAESDGSFETWYYNSVYETIKQNYPFEVNSDAIIKAVAETVLAKHPELLEDMIAATANQLDQYSTYFTPEELGTFNDYIDSEYVGIGVVVERGKGAIIISGLAPNGPAERAGLLPGDRFLMVNGQDVTKFNINQLTELVRGQEGTAVQLTVERGNAVYEFSVTREKVHQSTVSYEMIDDGVGYLRISMFSSATPEEMKQADEYFKGHRIKRLIIDLRDNPGGELVSVIDAMGYFVTRGKDVVSIEYGNSERDCILRSVGGVKGRCYYTKVAVLINENTASAAELFAGNIQYHKIGKLVGTTTYGKGTVQELVSLVNNETYSLGALKFTTAEYCLPDGTDVNGVGISPDYRVPNRSVRLDTSNMEPMVYCSGYAEGNKGRGVLAIKQRLDAIGYYVGDINQEFDGELTLAIKQLQKNLGLEETGIMDMNLQTLFNNIILETRVTYDDQFDAALNLVKAK